jgi:cell division protein FtsB
MDKKTTIEILDERVSQVLEQYKVLKNENALLHDNLASLNQSIESKNKEIETLSEENAMKDLEIEDIISKVENILN